MTTSRETLGELVERLRNANSPSAMKKVKNDLYEFYDNHGHPYTLRKRALDLGKRASLDMIEEGIQRYENSTAALALSEKILDGAKDLATRGQANLFLPKVAGHLEDMLTVLKSVRKSVDVVAEGTLQDEEDIENMVDVVNKVFTETRAIRDKVAAIQK